MPAAKKANPSVAKPATVDTGDGIKRQHNQGDGSTAPVADNPGVTPDAHEGNPFASVDPQDKGDDE